MSGVTDHTRTPDALGPPWHTCSSADRVATVAVHAMLSPCSEQVAPEKNARAAAMVSGAEAVRATTSSVVRYLP